MENEGQGPATPGTAARCEGTTDEVCPKCTRIALRLANQANAAEATAERLKAENASLLESLRAAEQLAESRGRMLSDSMALHEKANHDLFATDKKAAAAEQRAEAAEKEIEKLTEGGRVLVAANTKHFDAAASAEKRIAGLTGALRAMWVLTAHLPSGDAKVAVRMAIDAALDAALHDEERRPGTGCDRDCALGPEGGVLHSVEHQRRLAGPVKTCPVCGEERHAGTCIDAAHDEERSAPPPENKRCPKCGFLTASPHFGSCPDPSAAAQGEEK